MPGITDPTEEYFKDGSWGWDGTRWQKSPIQFGFSAAAGEILEDLSLAAGTNTIDGAAVPAGEVWVVTNIVMYYIGTVPTSIVAMIVRAPQSFYIYKQLSPASAAYYVRQVNLIMIEGDLMRMTIYGATLNNDAALHWLGYKMVIA